METNKAILIEISPKMKCCVLSTEYGPICVSSFDDRSGLLDVDSISLLDNNQIATRSDETNIIDQIHEAFLFRNDHYGRGTVSLLDPYRRQFMEEVSLIKGLRERLVDSSRIRGNSETQEVNERSPTETAQSRKRNIPRRTLDQSKRTKIVEFVNKSEAVIGELLSAHDQFRRQRKDNMLIKQVDSFCYSGEYFDSLNYNLEQVETLLDLSPGNGHYIELNDKMTKVTVHFFDEKGREHNLVGELSPQFPSNAPTWTCDLPTDFVPQWKITTKGSAEESGPSIFRGGLYGCVALFIELISSYQLLWDELQDLDENTWVIDPPLPARLSCTNRRIMLKSGLSAIISLEPENPRAIPLSMRLIGTGSEIEQFRSQYEVYTSARMPQKFMNSMKPTNELWCEQQSIRLNLETCFKISLPKSKMSNDEISKIECGICYTYSLSRYDQQHGESDELPNLKCSNDNCARNYHPSCLIEWIRSLPDSKTSFGRIFGSCPYCYETISIPID